MSKALIEKAFEKFMLDKFGIEAKNIDIKAWNIYKDNFDYAWNKGATWQREQLEAEKKALEKCYNIANDYTVELLKEIKHLQAEKKELKERCERYIWNLGGVSTLLLGYSIDEFNKEYALPALIDTNEFVKKYQHLQAENKTIREQLIKELREYCSKGFECGYGEVISCQDLLAKLDLLEKGGE